MVLAGCDTAVPAVQDVTGAYDLALGFRMAGASSVVASLWDVADRATEDLMAELYRRLAEGETTSDALAGAKRALRETEAFSDPSFWAPFQILGSGEAAWPRRSPAS